MILYPTETLYGLGVGVFDEKALQKLFELKERDESNSLLWLVRDIEDVKKYAEVGKEAEKVMNAFLPGPLTVVLPLKKDVLKQYPFWKDTVGFRISSDSFAQEVIEKFMTEHDMPLTSTSANISGMPTGATVGEILSQFSEKAKTIDEVVDGGERTGLPSTVIEFKDGKLVVHREGQVSIEDIENVL